MTSSHPAPPRTLETALELDPADWPVRENYFLLTALVVPRPIAWVSTLAGDGTPNLAPHSYFNAVASDPLHVMFSSTGVKDTLRNVRESGEFVLSIVSQELVEQMNFTSTDFPPDHDEFEWAQLETAPAVRVAAPRVKAAKAHLECRVAHIVPVGNSHVVIGEVCHLHVDPSVWRDGRVDPRLLDPVCRLSGTGYAELGEVFRLPRPRWADVAPGGRPASIPRRSRR